MAMLLHLGKQARLMLGDQRIDDLIQRRPLEHQIELMQA